MGVTLREGRVGQQKACQRQAGLPAHQPCVLQGVLVLPAHTHYPGCQTSRLKLYIFCHLTAAGQAYGKMRTVAELAASVCCLAGRP